MRTRHIQNCLKRLLNRTRLAAAAALLFWTTPFGAAAAAEKIAVFPEVPYDGYLVYESLVVFWAAIIGLVVIIRMKLKEIERTQALGADREDKEAPLLE
ncbi:MAG: hypothetical protein LLG93_03140 [Deltaproteobacteria bacterium]|nr:hypothetical protein [Deltaproteobacteria bacterium]